MFRFARLNGLEALFVLRQLSQNQTMKNPTYWLNVSQK